MFFRTAKKIGYSDKVIELFMKPKNVGEMKDADVSAVVGSVACGDVIRMYLKFDESGERIVDASFLSYGCAANIATSSITTEIVKGMTIEEAEKLTFREVVKELGGLPAVKYHCAVLSVNGLKSAIMKYEIKMGRRQLDEGFVTHVLRGVLDPLKGSDVITLKEVTGLKVEDGRVEIELNVAEEVRDVIEEEINQAFEDMDVDLKIKPTPGAGG